MEHDNKTKWLHVRLSDGEQAALIKAFKKTNCRKLSDYARNILLGKPVIGFYRNRSLDELMAEAVLLRKELNAIGNNFNQAVHRLHTLDHLSQMQFWLQGFERDKKVLFDKVDEIKLVVERMAKIWLQ